MLYIKEVEFELLVNRKGAGRTDLPKSGNSWLEIENAIRAIRDRRSSSLAGYAVRLSRPIHRALEAAKETHKIEFPENTDRIDPYGKTIADVLMDGYYWGVPSRVRIRFFHNQQRLSAPEVSLGDLQILDLYGSAAIWYSFDDRTNPTLAAYRPQRYRETPWTAADAVKAIAGYMAACASEEGKKVDEKAHKIIGGRTHIAIVTQDGFSWAPGYEPLPELQ